MKKSIYSERTELTNWEIIGIEAYLKDNFDIKEPFIYCDKTLHLDLNDYRYGIYKISEGGNDLYITIFSDVRMNDTFRLNLGHDNFTKLSENFDFICDYTNIFEF